MSTDAKIRELEDRCMDLERAYLQLVDLFERNVGLLESVMVLLRERNAPQKVREPDPRPAASG